MDKTNNSFDNRNELLKKYRGDVHPDDFAEILEISPRTLHRYEKGERKIPKGVLRLAQDEYDQRSINTPQTPSEAPKSIISGRSIGFYAQTIRMLILSLLEDEDIKNRLHKFLVDVSQEIINPGKLRDEPDVSPEVPKE